MFWLFFQSMDILVAQSGWHLDLFLFSFPLYRYLHQCLEMIYSCFYSFDDTLTVVLRETRSMRKEYDASSHDERYKSLSGFM